MSAHVASSEWPLFTAEVAEEAEKLQPQNVFEKALGS
jgi:hypothetical protein